MSHLMIISGSHRNESNSVLVAKHLGGVASGSGSFESTKILDLGNADLPMWDEALFSDEQWKTRWSTISRDLKEAHAFILISPEWSGMATPAIKNFMLLCSADEVGDKPCLPVGVSAARGGAYPISEMRMSGYKNNRLSFISEQLIFRDVINFLSDAEYEDKTYMKDRSKYAMTVLAEYAKAFKTVRDSGVIDYTEYPNGM